MTISSSQISYYNWSLEFHASPCSLLLFLYFNIISSIQSLHPGSREPTNHPRRCFRQRSIPLARNSVCIRAIRRLRRTKSKRSIRFSYCYSRRPANTISLPSPRSISHTVRLYDKICMQLHRRLFSLSLFFFILPPSPRSLPRFPKTSRVF